MSIILPVYNGSRFLASALETVRAQTFAGWELIVVDDGSVDDTAAQLDQMPPDDRWHIIHQANLGLAAARNRGLAAAVGEYAAFLDVDDEWHPSYLAQMCAALDGAPEAVAACAGWQYVDEGGGRLPQTMRLSPELLAQLAEELPWRNAILPSALVARRSVVREVGGFDEQLRACEDWDLWLRLLAVGPFVAVPQVLMGYRVHSSSMTENVAGIERERLKVNAKHLGSLDAPLPDWPLIRRQAVGFTYFNSALNYLRQHELARGREKILQAVYFWPGLLTQDEFYYELGCAFQPRGVRGSSTQLDLPASEQLIRAAVFEWLDPTQPAFKPQRAWLQANLVLARVARSSGDQRAARRYAWRTIHRGSLRQRWQAMRIWAHSFWSGEHRASPAITAGPLPDGRL